MAFKATFEVDSKEYRIIKCSYSLHQAVDDTGRPSSTARGGTVNIVLESTDDTSLFEWMCDSYMNKECKIIFNKRDEDSKLKELVITEAYMVEYSESFDSDNDLAMVQSFSLSAHSISMGDGELENEWAL